MSGGSNVTLDSTQASRAVPHLAFSRKAARDLVSREVQNVSIDHDLPRVFVGEFDCTPREIAAKGLRLAGVPKGPYRIVTDIMNIVCAAGRQSLRHKVAEERKCD